MTRFLPRPFILALVSVLAACEFTPMQLPNEPQPPPPPPPPAPGTIYGRVVMARPGTSQRVAAEGAVLSISGTSLEGTANAEGRFLIEGIQHPGGLLLVRLDVDGDGDFDRQKLLDLDPYGVGVDRQIDLGDLLLNENALMSGRVRLLDRLDRSGGHGGITVFVPEGPFVTVTADDGTWALTDMPEGPTSVAFLKPGYVASGFDGLSLRGGEELRLREVVLTPIEGEERPGTISGTVQLNDEPNGLTIAATIRAISATHEEISTTTDAVGGFVLNDVTPGVYSLAISQTGYVTAVIPNLAVLSGLEVRLGAPVVLAPKPPAPPPCPEGEACMPADPCRTATIRCIEGKAVCVDSATNVAPGTSCGDDAVCNPQGACMACVEDEDCGDPEGCVGKRITCVSGEPVCEETGGRKEPGAGCGTGAVCDVTGACIACDQGARCGDLESCITSRIDCSTGTPTCAETATVSDPGTPCGTGKYCTPDLECAACEQNASCATTDPCHVGAISCASGLAECLDLGFLKPAGSDCGEGRVCGPTGACVSCEEDVSCVPPNRCRLGAISCATGAPRCVDTAALVTPGTSCGVDRVCDPDGSCVTCVEGASCSVDGDPCVVGSLHCTTGVPQCLPTTTPRAAGLTCAEGRVCDGAGQCVVCAADLPCIPDVVCRLGRTSCATGASACVATEGLPVPGTSCGDDHVCSPAGECVTCDAGAECTAPTACRVGAIACDSGAPLCTDTTTNLDPGTSCGQDHVCDPSGNCVACIAGATCEVPGDPCAVGALQCSTGVAVCVATAQKKAPGTTCAQNKVCSPTGTCDACVADLACTPTTACRVGRTSCSTGASTCVATAGLVQPGTGCGTGQVCSPTGTCTACVTGASCQPSDPCANGSIECSSGTPFCATVSSKTAGTSCGTGRVCNSAAQCLACVAGVRCTASNACVDAFTDCSTGDVRCVATTTPVANGTTCGTDKVCNGGTCATCVAGADCVPGNKCKVGTTTCASGTSVCAQQATDRPAGYACGTNLVCNAGQCLPSGLVVVSGANQSGLSNQSMSPVIFQLNDGAGVPKANVRVDFSATSGTFLSPAFATTAADGRVALVFRMPRNTGTITIDALAADGARASVTATVADPSTAGTMLPVVNATGASGSTGDGGPASVARLTTPGGMDVAADGTLYFTDYSRCVVRKVAPDGTITKLAGTDNNCASSGDNGLATSARLYSPFDVALKPDGTKLYVSEYNGNRIREIDLATGIIRTLAGGGTQGSPSYGDNGPASDAQLRPNHLAFGPDGALYFMDVTALRLRRIDLATTIVTRVFPTAANPSCSDGPVVYISPAGYTEAGSFAFDAAGNLYLSGYICGSAVSNSVEYGVVRRATDGTVSHVAGKGNSGQALTGIAATQAYFQMPPVVALDAANNVFLFEPAWDRARVAESATGRLRNVFGSVGVIAGDFGASGSAQVDGPSMPLFVGRDLYFADTGNFAIRRVYELGQATVPRVTIAKTSGDAQSAKVAAATTQPIAVTVSDAQANPLAGYTVAFTAVDPGGAVYAPTVATSPSGLANTTVRVGLAPGTYRFEARFTDTNGNAALGSPIGFTATATAPAAGTIFGALNVTANAGIAGMPGPATLANTKQMRGIVAATDGTFYVSDYGSHCVYKVTPAGYVSVVAGKCGTAGFAGDFGPAVDARIDSPWGLALSPSETTLYIVDAGNNRVRAVDLTSATGMIYTYAGGGSQATAPFGDGGIATAASITSPRFITVGPDGSVYVASLNQYRIRKILPNGTISSVVVPPNTCTSTTFGLGVCASNDGAGCSMVLDPDGSLLVSYASICGQATVGSIYTGPYVGIARFKTDGTQEYVAGKYAGATPEGTVLANWSFNRTANKDTFSYSTPVLFRDRAGALLMVVPNSHAVYRVDPTTTAVTRLAGSATFQNGFAGNDAAATSALLDTPWAVAALPNGHYAVVDGQNATVRIVW